MATPKQCTLCVGRGPDEVIRKRLSYLRMYTLTSGLRRTPHRHVPSGAIGGRLFHLRVGSNKTARSAYLRVKFHLGLFFFRSSLRLEMFKTNWWTRLEWFWLPGMPDRRSRKLKQARRLPTALQLRTFARTDYSLAKRTPKWQSASGRSVKTFTSLQTKRCLDPRRENPPDLVRGRSQQAAKPEPILAPRVHPWRSGSPVEAGLGEPGEQWLDQGRENSPILDRSRPIAAGDTPDALAAATTAVSSRAKGWRAAMPVLSGGGGLLHRRAFSLRASNQTMLRLPGPDMRGLKESDQNLQGDLPAAGDTSPPRLVHVERSAGSIPRQSEAKPAEAGEERSRSYSMAEPGFARRKAGAITDLKAATRWDIQTVAQQVYELIVDRVRREKERLGR